MLEIVSKVSHPMLESSNTIITSADIVLIVYTWVKKAGK